MRRLAFILALVTAASCGDSGINLNLAPTDTNVAGTYTLQTSNGHNLPISAGGSADGTILVDMTADVLTIYADGTYMEVTTLFTSSSTDIGGSSSNSTSSGTWTISDGVIDFQMVSGGSAQFTGSVSGTKLSVVYLGSRLEYTRS